MVTVERHPSATPIRRKSRGLNWTMRFDVGVARPSCYQPSLDGRPDLTPFRIKAGSYPGIETDIDTFGLMGVLVTQSGASIPLIEAVMKALFETGSNKASPSLFKAPSSDEINVRRQPKMSPRSIRRPKDEGTSDKWAGPDRWPVGTANLNNLISLIGAIGWSNSRIFRRHSYARVLLPLRGGPRGPSRWECGFMLRKRSQRFCLA